MDVFYEKKELYWINWLKYMIETCSLIWCRILFWSETAGSARNGAETNSFHWRVMGISGVRTFGVCVGNAFCVIKGLFGSCRAIQFVWCNIGSNIRRNIRQYHYVTFRSKNDSYSAILAHIISFLINSHVLLLITQYCTTQTICYGCTTSK